MALAEGVCPYGEYAENMRVLAVVDAVLAAGGDRQAAKRLPRAIARLLGPDPRKKLPGR